jgi:prepilin-type N-terminal cleavage/methylation domain-containing protein
MTMFTPRARGFTLIELMTVITIIALLATVVFAMLQQSRAKGRDSLRIQTLKELQKAIDMYYSDYGYYPPISGASAASSRLTTATCSDGTTGNPEWCQFIAAIAPYHKGGVDDPVSVSQYTYLYDADGAQPQYYGLMAVMEDSGSFDLADNDGGQHCSTCSNNKAFPGYEIGNEPAYCAQVQPTRNWRTGVVGELCGP